MTSKFKVIKFFLILFEKIKYRARILFRGNYKVIKMYCLPYQQCSLNTLPYTVFEMYQKMFTNFMKHTLSNTKIVISKNVIVTPLLNIITNNTNCTIQCRRTIINIKIYLYCLDNLLNNEPRRRFLLIICLLIFISLTKAIL